MDVVYERCCGLDVHKKTVVGCVLTPETKEIRTFSTMTEDLLDMVDWLHQHQCTHVAMESTGSYWKPIYNLLESADVQVLVVNAKHMKNVPGRKTDVKDAEWIASLLRHGLLQASYIPNREQRELRELLRDRRSLIEERAREVNRIQKVLEGANIKLASVASDTLSKSGRAMLDAMIQGEENPEVLSELAKGRMKAKKAELRKALQGLMGGHQRMMLATQLRHIDYLDEEIARLDEEIKKRLRPFEEDLELLETIPGVGRRTAEHRNRPCQRRIYIVWLDADDLLMPSYCSECVSILNEHLEVGFVYSTTKVFGAQDDIWSHLRFSCLHLLVDNYLPCSAMFRRVMWETIGGYAEDLRNGYEDWDFWLSAVELGWIGWHLKRVLFWYRKHGQSMLTSSNSQRRQLKAELRRRHARLYSTRSIVSTLFKEYWAIPRAVWALLKEGAGRPLVSRLKSLYEENNQLGVE